MSKFFEKYLKKPKSRQSRLRARDINKNSVEEEGPKLIYTPTRASDIVDKKHQISVCKGCLSYSWKEEGPLMSPWCKKADKAVFEMDECPKKRWWKCLWQ